MNKQNSISETIKLLEDIKSSPNGKQTIDDFITFIQCYLRSGDEINKILKVIGLDINKEKDLTKSVATIIEKYRNM